MSEIETDKGKRWRRNVFRIGRIPRPVQGVQLVKMRFAQGLLIYCGSIHWIYNNVVKPVEKQSNISLTIHLSVCP